MANASTRITITHDKELAADLKNQFQPASGNGKVAIEQLMNFFNRIGSGAANASVEIRVDDGAGVKSSGTITFSSLANNDTITVGGVTFTAKTSGASGSTQFNLGASDTAAAANAVVAINAHASLTDLLTASSSGAVITVTAAQKTVGGNLIGIAISAHGSVSGANLASGAASGSITAISYPVGM